MSMFSKGARAQDAPPAPEPGQARLEYVPLSQIVRWPRNTKRHDAAALGQSVERFGFVQPLLVDERTGQLVAGHGRLEALQARKAEGKPPPARVGERGGEWLVPVIRGVSFASDAEAEAYLLADNRLSEIGGWDDAGLAKMLEDLQAMSSGLDGTGFTAADVEEVFHRAQNPFETANVPIDELRRHPRNYREHPEDQLAHIIKSIESHGFYRNVVVARDNTILAGHGVVEAAKKMGKRMVPVIRLDVAPDDPRALKVMTSDNEIRNLAETDDRALTELLKEILGADGLAGTGFDEKQLAALAIVSRPTSEIENFDEAAAWVGMPEYVSSPQPYKVIVNVESREDVTAVLALLQCKPSKSDEDKRFWSTWWPPRARKDLSSVKFDGDAAGKEDGAPDA